MAGVMVIELLRLPDFAPDCHFGGVGGRCHGVGILQQPFREAQVRRN